ncbi:MAG TPA: insulinase family protein, partial [Polyangiaceae bacterium]
MSRTTSRLALATGAVFVALVAGAAPNAPKAAPAPAATPAPATTPLPSAPAPTAPLLPFEKYTLDNGLTVLLHRDTSLPIVAVEIWYRVGPVNEPPGRSGFA